MAKWRAQIFVRDGGFSMRQAESEIELLPKRRASSALTITSSRAQGRPSGTHSTLNWAYWSLPLLLTGVQYFVTITSMHEIRLEELAESVRNVFWLSHRLVYDGA